MSHIINRSDLQHMTLAQLCDLLRRLQLQADATRQGSIDHSNLFAAIQDVQQVIAIRRRQLAGPRF